LVFSKFGTFKKSKNDVDDASVFVARVPKIGVCGKTEAYAYVYVVP